MLAVDFAEDISECALLPLGGAMEAKMDSNLQALTAEIVSAYVGHNNVRSDELPALIQATFSALSTLGQRREEPQTEYTPAVNPKRSVTPDYLISLIDGKHYKSLKRHLTRHGLTPPEYRERYGLKPDYPMTAAAYAAKRSELAKSMGLGRKRAEAAAQNARGTVKKATRAKKGKAAA